MKNEVRPIDANSLARRIREYMDDFPHAATRLAACRSVLSMLGDEGQTPTICPTLSREAWKPCKMCNGEKALYQQTVHTKLYMNTFGEARTLVTECVPCPPYSQCCMKGISANSAFKINFCPECGRPLTDEAWAELEKRLRG